MADTVNQFIDPAFIVDGDPLFDDMPVNNPEQIWSSPSIGLNNSWTSDVNPANVPNFQHKEIDPVQSLYDGSIDWSMINLSSKSCPSRPYVDSRTASTGSSSSGSATFTPPTALSPDFSEPIDTSFADEVLPQLPEETLLSQHRSQPTEPLNPPNSAQTTRKRRGRKRKILSAAEQKKKHEELLERNRIAASKCRERKKEYYSGLQDHKLILERTHAQLKHEKDTLLLEIQYARMMLSQCEKCGQKEEVKNWLERTAKIEDESKDVGDQSQYERSDSE